MNPILEIKFKTIKHLKVFMQWLDGQGEQDYWIWTEENTGQCPKINYDYDNRRITIDG